MVVAHFTQEELEELRRFDAQIDNEEKQRYREQQRAYRERCPERILARNRAWKAKNREHLAEYQRARRRAMKEKEAAACQSSLQETAT